MKGTTKGILVMAALLVGLPVMVDIIILVTVPHGISFFGPTTFTFFGCIKLLPLYFLYLLVGKLRSRMVNEFYKLI
ncbi:MAG: hypothetical protein ABI480_11460 [Chitinophagaceae bacterium]